MKAQWQQLSAKFDALQEREKKIVAGAALVGVAMLGFSLWVDPAQVKLASTQKRIVKETTDMQSLQAQVTVLRAQLKDPDAANKAALADVKRQIAGTEKELHSYDGALVAPERMSKLLQSLLAQHRGLELVGVQTLPPTPLLPEAPRAEARAEGKPVGASAAPAMPAAKGMGIHKHGIEIKVAGNYLDLLAYVAELERLPQKLLWEKMLLAANTYPKSELTLMLYTLSLDPVWLVV